MNAKKRKSSKTKKEEEVQFNILVNSKFLDLLKKNAKKKGFTQKKYIIDLVTKDGKALDNSDVTAINAQLHTIDNWQRKIFFTTDSIAKLFMRYMYEDFKYMPDLGDSEYAAKAHGLEKYENFINDFRTTKNFYKRSFLEQMYKVVLETTADFEKLNPMIAPDKDEIVKERYYRLIQYEIENLSSIFTPEELDFIAALCHGVEWNEEKDIKKKLLNMLLEASEIELNQSGLNRDQLGEKISNLTQVQLIPMIEYIEGFCELYCLSPIKENELFKKKEA